MDDLEYNDLEYREERKESCVQPVKRNIPLKLKSTTSNSSLQSHLPLSSSMPAVVAVNDVSLGPSVNKMPRINLGDIDERLDEDLRGFPNNKKEFKVEKLNWSFKVDLIGNRATDQNIFCCEICQAPILLYGRMIPCKHVFCVKCARDSLGKCAKESCQQPVERIEEVMYGKIFICTYGKTTANSSIFENQIQSPSKIACGRSYMSSRDLNAHIQHRHQPADDASVTQQFATARANLITITTAPQQQYHMPYSQLQPALLPTPPQHHVQYLQQQQQQAPLLDLQKRGPPFDFNLKLTNPGTNNNNNFKPSNFY